jgi:hypothetical protein
MKLFSQWELWKGKGLLRLSKLTTSAYNHIAITKPGRKALTQCDAILHLRKFCDQCPAERSFDDIIMKTAALVAVCYEKCQLPLDHLESPIRFRIPDLDKLTKAHDPGSSSDDEGSESENDGEPGQNENEIDLVDDDDGDNDSNEEDNSISEDENCSSGLQDNNNNNDDSMSGVLSPSLISASSSRRESIESGSSLIKPATPVPLNRLLEYSTFFRELNNKPSNGGGLFSGHQYESYENSSTKHENCNETGDTRRNSNIPTSKHSYTFLRENPEFKYWDSIEDLRRRYIKIANSISHVAPFVKLAYPEISLGYSYRTSENMLSTVDRRALR